MYIQACVHVGRYRFIVCFCLSLGQEPRQTTSNIGHLQRPTITALVHGLNRNYYSITINCRKGELENQMLMNLHKNKWNDALKLEVRRQGSLCLND